MTRVLLTNEESTGVGRICFWLNSIKMEMRSMNFKNISEAFRLLEAYRDFANSRRIHCNRTLLAILI